MEGNEGGSAGKHALTGDDGSEGNRILFVLIESSMTFPQSTPTCTPLLCILTFDCLESCITDHRIHGEADHVLRILHG